MAAKSIGGIGRLATLAALVGAMATTPAMARNIVLSNDDGLTSNVKALYDALKAQGHDVIVSVPCSGQSGMGAAILGGPLGPLRTECLHGAARPGDPGAGPMTRPGLERDFFYVDGTPVMATLYALDVVAVARWGRAPDLVLSGPNVGQNVGPIVVSSGTVSNVQYALMRGIAGIAVSAGTNTAGDASLVDPLSTAVAARTVDLIDFLDRRSRGGPILPNAVALNVNFPDKLDGARWKMARIGAFQRYDVRFVSDAAAAAGKRAEQGKPLPGVALTRSDRLPTSSERGDEAAVSVTDISVSVLQLAYDPSGASVRAAGRLLKGLPSLHAGQARGKGGCSASIDDGCKASASSPAREAARR